VSAAYDLIAIDLDGTLLDPDGRLPIASIDAVARARAAGMRVVVCTGRGLGESRAFLDRLFPDAHAVGAPVIVAGGAMIADVASGRTTHRWAMDEALVRELCEHFSQRELAPLLLKDRHAAGFDYLVVNSGPLEEPSRWWFSVMDVEVKFIDDPAHDPHPEHTVRVGFAAHTQRMLDLARSVTDSFGPRTTVQHFAAVSGDDGNQEGGKDNAIHLLEVFDRQVNKWSAVRHVAAELDIGRDRIAAIGDEVNDLPMIEGAALGIAMGNAVKKVSDVADRLTLSNADDGLAYAIDRILDGEW
jgi:HAD superfamily hydrolase (TIGR01484 family)